LQNYEIGFVLQNNPPDPASFGKSDKLNPSRDQSGTK